MVRRWLGKWACGNGRPTPLTSILGRAISSRVHLYRGWKSAGGQKLLEVRTRIYQREAKIVNEK